MRSFFIMLKLTSTGGKEISVKNLVKFALRRPSPADELF
jgi:hypothetical protein